MNIELHNYLVDAAHAIRHEANSISKSLSPWEDRFAQVEVQYLPLTRAAYSMQSSIDMAEHHAAIWCHQAAQFDAKPQYKLRRNVVMLYIDVTYATVRDIEVALYAAVGRLDGVDGNDVVDFEHVTINIHGCFDVDTTCGRVWDIHHGLSYGYERADDAPFRG